MVVRSPATVLARESGGLCKLAEDFRIEEANDLAVPIPEQIGPLGGGLLFNATRV